MAYKIDPDQDRVYVEEFRKNLMGHHSPGLQRVLNTLRRSPDGRQLTILMTRPFQSWVIAWLPKHRWEPIEIDDSIVFESREEAEWHVFCRRWEAATGEKIDNR
jgi:hypothetical protein